MGYSGGVYTRPFRWTVQQSGGGNVNDADYDTLGDDYASALGSAVLRDGTGPATADLPFGGKSVTGARQAAVAGEMVEYAQYNAGAGQQNLIHNASFLINQRQVGTVAPNVGSVGLSSGQYGHDRWKAGAPSGCGYNFNTVGIDAQLVITVGSLIQVVDGRDIVGGVYTLVHSGSASCRVYQGSAPSFAGSPYTSASLTGGVDTYVEFSTGSVIRPQLSTGSGPKGFTRRPLWEDAILCRSYYERIPIEYVVYQVPGSGNFRIPVRYAMQKIKNGVTPTVAVAFTQNPFNISYAAAAATVDQGVVTFSSPGNAPILGLGIFVVSYDP